jgi:plastocyanin
MKSRKVQRLAAPAVAAVALAALVPAVAGAGAGAGPGEQPTPTAQAAAKKPVKKTVRLFDNYYEPANLTVPKDSTIIWKWPDTTGDSHDVSLDKGPKGVKKFQSDVAASEFSYRRKLTKKGKYHIVCTLHEEMTMDIRVR